MLPITVTIYKAWSSEWGSLKTSWFVVFKTRITLTPFVMPKSISAPVLHFLCGFQQAIFLEYVAYQVEKKTSSVKKCFNCLFIWLPTVASHQMLLREQAYTSLQTKTYDSVLKGDF